MTHPPLIAFSLGAHGSQAAQNELDKYGWRGWHVKWWNRARLNGATTLIERFPATRFGEEPNIAHVLRLVGTDFMREARKITAAHSPGRSPTRVDLYTKPFSDLPHATDEEISASWAKAQDIVRFAAKCAAGMWVENADGEFERACIAMCARLGVYRGMEPSRPKTGRTGVPSIDMERRLDAAGIKIDGSNWPADAEPFANSTGPRILVRRDDTPTTRARIDETRRLGWTAGEYMWRLAQGVNP